jgi:hypothetical protein
MLPSTILPCNHANILPCYHATMPLCYHATMQPCNHATMLPCNHATMLPCYHATMPPCYQATMQPCYHATMMPCNQHSCEQFPASTDIVLYFSVQNMAISMNYIEKYSTSCAANRRLYCKTNIILGHGYGV